MTAPERPTRPQQTEKPANGGWLSLMLAAVAGMIIFTALLFLTGGFLGLVLAIGGGVFGLAALHYLVWGWWLSKFLYAEQEAEDRRQEQEAERQNEKRPDDRVPRDPRE